MVLKVRPLVQKHPGILLEFLKNTNSQAFSRNRHSGGGIQESTSTSPPGFSLLENLCTVQSQGQVHTHATPFNTEANVPV
jgi:hypothetical protein